MPVILAINYPGHTASAALFKSGSLVAACAQERYDRQKKSGAFPAEAIHDCLRIGGLDWKDIDVVARCYDPNLLREYQSIAPNENEVYRATRLLGKLEEDIFGLIGKTRKPQRFYRHHLCHLASTYFPSGFKNALLVSHDGVGEIQTQSVGIGTSGRIDTISPNIDQPNSLGNVYQAITYYLGWRVGDEGIVMGLAPFGDATARPAPSGPTYEELFRQMIVQNNDHIFSINQDWFAYNEVRDKWVSDLFVETFGPRRHVDGEIHQRHKNIAAALQNRLCEVVERQLRYYRKETGLRRLCVAGGVGLNCSLNGHVQATGLFDEIFVTPASGDDGTPIGAGYLASAELSGKNLLPQKMHNFNIGSRFSDDRLAKALSMSDVSFRQLEDFDFVAQLLSDGKVVAWFQSGAEFGPRALGARSILANPFSEQIRDHINEKVKFREMFRPLAPAVLDEEQSTYFDLAQDSPHMLLACKVKKDKKSIIPAVVHVDDSARVQTVSRESNPAFYELLQAFRRLTGVGVLLNTSFNVKGQPIVNTPEEAIETFNGTNIDALCMGKYLASKS